MKQSQHEIIKRYKENILGRKDGYLLERRRRVAGVDEEESSRSQCINS
jgi:hypothetical protein